MAAYKAQEARPKRLPLFRNIFWVRN